MKKVFLVIITALMCVGGLAQQRKVTPVENPDHKSQKPQLHYYDKHGNPLSEPVLIWAEDTVVKTRSKPIYKQYDGIYAGFNFFDAILKLAGQSYCSYDVWAQVSLYNWVLPTVEAGVGWSDMAPADKNYHYKGKPAPYLKIGVDYNFLYNSTPDYSAYFGLRAGWSTFSYDITDIVIYSEYWNQVQGLSLRNQKSTAFYGEVLAGLRVKIWQRLSMGWSVRYKFPFSVSNGVSASPAYIPGYGGRNNHFFATFSLIYKI